MIIGFTGRRRSGKDFAAKMAIEVFGGRRFAFADDLKIQCMRIFGLTPDQVSTAKETQLPAQVFMDDYVTQMSKESRLDIQPAGCVASTPRQILQFYGTEYVRAARDTYWIDQVLKVQIPVAQQRDGSWLRPWRWRYARHSFITDCRFDNECAAVHRAGGIVIRVVRPDLAGRHQSAHDSHASETAIDRLPVHHEVVNTMEETSFREAVRRSIVEAMVLQSAGV